MILKKLSEDLNQALAVDPHSEALTKAKNMGLTYVGFGRFENSQSGQLSHIVQNGKLVPYTKAIKTSGFKQNNADDFGAYGQIAQPEVDQLNSALAAHYDAGKYDNREIDALNHFVNVGHHDINNRLSGMPHDIKPHQMEPLTPDDRTPDMIGSLDSAVKKSRSPGDFTIYAKLGQNQDILSIQPRTSFRTKGYMMGSTSINSLLQTVQPDKMSSRTGRPVVGVLQVQVKKNSRGLFGHNFSQDPMGEFVLPRGAKIHVVNGPSKLVGSDANSGNLNLEVQYLDCVYK